MVSLGRISWVHLAAPLLLAVANLLSLLGLNTVFELVALLAYGCVIVALHWESMQTFLDRQQVSKAMAQDALFLSQERQRYLEVSEIISTVPSLDQSLEHVARSMAHITHSDQSVILVLDVNSPDQAHLAAIYSPERPVDLKKLKNPSFSIATYTALKATITSGNSKNSCTLIQNGNGFDSLYTIWHEERLGPMLIQPLLIQGKTIGAFILGNPVTRQPIQEADQALCRSLASQIAMMVEAYRHHSNLQAQIEALTTPSVEPASSEEVISSASYSQ